MKILIMITLLSLLPIKVTNAHLNCMQDEIIREDNLNLCITKIYDQSTYLRKKFAMLLIESGKLNQSEQDINYQLREKIMLMIGKLDVKLRELQNLRDDN